MNRHASPARRSLLRRLLTGFMATMLALWLVSLAGILYEVTQVEGEFARLQLETAARQSMAALRPLADRPAQMRAYAQEAEQLQGALYRHMNMLLLPYQLQVWQGTALIYESQGLPLARPTDTAMLTTLSLRGRPALAWSLHDSGSDLTVRVAQQSLFAFAMSPASIGYYLLPLVVCLPFLLLPAWLTVRLGMRPLRNIASAIEARAEADLSPLPASPYRELSPLVSAINRLMLRLSQRLEREREFLHDAAHELKTPLAVIQLNAEALQQTADPHRAQLAQQGMAQGLARATHAIHQLLALSRSGSDADSDARQAIDLVELLRDRLANVIVLALQRGIELELQAPPACILPLHRESTAALIDNLIDNAIKYSPDGARIQVSLSTPVQGVWLEILDQGPGIPNALRAKVFERFYRVPGNGQAGSGLGLSIAERAAARNGAQIALLDPANGPGLLVRVQFAAPLPESAHPAHVEKEQQ